MALNKCVINEAPFNIASSPVFRLAVLWPKTNTSQCKNQHCIIWKTAQYTSELCFLAICYCYNTVNVCKDDFEDFPVCPKFFVNCLNLCPIDFWLNNFFRLFDLPMQHMCFPATDVTSDTSCRAVKSGSIVWQFAVHSNPSFEELERWDFQERLAVGSLWCDFFPGDGCCLFKA